MSQKNMGRLAQDMKREVIAIIGRLKDPRLEGGLLTVTRLDVHLRNAPRFLIVEDDGAAYAAHINELLRELNVSGSDDTREPETED